LSQRGLIDLSIHSIRRTIVRYSVLLPRCDSPGWKLVDDRGDIVFTGNQQNCEEWLDLADMRHATSGSSTGSGTLPKAIRLPFFNNAVALLRGLWSDGP
jgi:hypothetical protein